MTNKTAQLASFGVSSDQTIYLLWTIDRQLTQQNDEIFQHKPQKERVPTKKKTKTNPNPIHAENINWKVPTVSTWTDTYDILLFSNK